MSTCANKKPILLHYFPYFCEVGLETYIKNACLCIVVFTTKVARDAHVPTTYINLNIHTKNTSVVDQPLNGVFNIAYSKFFQF